MAIPKVFVSSTYYDLKYIRESLTNFIKLFGFEPVLFEDGDIFFNPRQNTYESCLREVQQCQLFILIVGGRYGGSLDGDERSITWQEFDEAFNRKIRVFTLIEENVWNEFNLFNQNKNNPHVDNKKVIYPNVPKHHEQLFAFIESIRKKPYNNALGFFKSFFDIEDYLRKQWAAMVFDLLSADSEYQRLEEARNKLETVNSRIEMLVQQLTVATSKIVDEDLSNEVQRNIDIYDHMIEIIKSYPTISLVLERTSLTNPELILIHPTLLDAFSYHSDLKYERRLHTMDNTFVNYIYRVFKDNSGSEVYFSLDDDRFRQLEGDYIKMRTEMFSVLKRHKYNQKDLITIDVVNDGGQTWLRIQTMFSEIFGSKTKNLLTTSIAIDDNPNLVSEISFLPQKERWPVLMERFKDNTRAIEFISKWNSVTALL
ncbi:MAG: DUF4062 domain-containing protein [Candidatus Sericytochromatia bacterium]